MTIHEIATRLVGFAVKVHLKRHKQNYMQMMQ